MRAIESNRPKDPICIGIVGEIYTAVDGDSNLDLDEKLIDMGVEVHRMINFSNRYTHYNEPNLRRGVSDYVRYDMGPTSTITIAAAKNTLMRGLTESSMRSAQAVHLRSIASRRFAESVRTPVCRSCI